MSGGWEGAAEAMKLQGILEASAVHTPVDGRGSDGDGSASMRREEVPCVCVCARACARVRVCMCHMMKAQCAHALAYTFVVHACLGIDVYNHTRRCWRR